jgi:hypothetical protein
MGSGARRRRRMRRSGGLRIVNDPIMLILSPSYLISAAVEASPEQPCQDGHSKRDRLNLPKIFTIVSTFRPNGAANICASLARIQGQNLWLDITNPVPPLL